MTNDTLDKFFNTATFYIVMIMLFVFSIPRIVIPIMIEYDYINTNEGMEVLQFYLSVSIDNVFYIFPLFSSIFSHLNLLHLFVNGLVLISFGIVVEMYFENRKKYVLFFIIVGVISSLFQLIVFFYQNNPIGLLGASGSIAGLIGFLAVKKPNLKAYFLFIIPMKLRTMVSAFVVITLGIILFRGLGAFGVAHVAHLAGLFSGIIYGYKKKDTPSDMIEPSVSVEKQEDNYVIFKVKPNKGFNFSAKESDIEREPHIYPYTDKIKVMNIDQYQTISIERNGVEIGIYVYPFGFIESNKNSKFYD